MGDVATELRVHDAQLEVRADGRRKFMEGLAAPYGVWEPVSFYEELLEPSVFRKSTQERARKLPFMLFHDYQTLPIGHSVEWTHSEAGLRGRWLLEDSDRAQEAAELAASGSMTGLSVGFKPVKSVWDSEGEPPRVRRVEGMLREVSLVPVAAYPDAEVTLVRTGERRRTPRVDAARKWWDALQSVT